MTGEIESVLVGRTWRLTEIDGEPSPARPPVEIAFEDDDRVHGTAGVNRFTGSCRVGAAFVEFGPLAMTLMAGLPEAMALENAVLQVLSGHQPLAVTGDALTIGAARFTALAPRDDGESVTVSGTVFYRERTALPPGAVVVVQVLDTSRADAPSTTLAETRFDPETQVPVRFTLTVPRSAFTASGRFAFAARIELDGSLAWVSDAHHAVAPDGPDEVEILVRRAGGAGR
jgi:putative lipoprotein